MITWHGSELMGRILAARPLIYLAYLGNITPSKICTDYSFKTVPVVPNFNY